MNWKCYMIGCAVCISIFGCKKEDGFDYSVCYIEWPADTYIFPIRPGTEEWGLLTSSSQMDSVLLIPDSILLEISTDGLIQTCMDYPRWFDMFFDPQYNFQRVLEILYSNFNGLQELFNRSDAGPKLHHYYNQMYPECDKNNWSQVLPGQFVYAWIEVIIAQYEILGQLDTEEIDLLCSDVLQVYQRKKSLDYDLFSKKTSLLILGRILLINEFEPLVQSYNTNDFMRLFIDSSVLAENLEILLDIELFSESYLLN